VLLDGPGRAEAGEEAQMNEIVAMALVLLLATSGYAAGRMHGQFGYRLGYRFGYRQGYFDGDRASWSRRRREMQAVVASVLSAPAEERNSAYAGPVLGGTMYASDIGADDEDDDEIDEVDQTETRPIPTEGGRHARQSLIGA
jgi:hypothetical protein